MTEPSSESTELPPDAVRVSLADRRQIHGWSCGEVTSTELFDRQEEMFHPGGLFSESIFGPLQPLSEVKRKYLAADPLARVMKQTRHLLGSEPVRQKQFGHIRLAVPVLHPWFYGSDESPLAQLLGLSHAELQRVVRRQARVNFRHPGPQLSFELCELTESERQDAAWFDAYNEVTGPWAVAEMLARFSCGTVFDVQRELLSTAGRTWPPQEFRRRMKRLNLLQAAVEQRLAPAGFVIEALPVIPAGLRNLHRTPDGRIQVDWLTAAYRRILRISNAYAQAERQYCGERPPSPAELRRVRKLELWLRCEIEWLFAELLQRGSPLRRVQRLVQEPRFFSGSILPVVPDSGLRLFECRVPLQLENEIWNGPVAALPRALPPTVCQLLPTESRADFVALQPKPAMERAIRVHPLVIAAAGKEQSAWRGRFQHLRTEAAQRDADNLSFPTSFWSALRSRRCELPVEFVVGCAWASRQANELKPTRERPDRWNSELSKPHPMFRTPDDVAAAWENGIVSLSQVIVVFLPRGRTLNPEDERVRSCLFAGRRLCTTAGRAILNSLLPEESPFEDEPWTGPLLRELLLGVDEKFGPQRAAVVLERLMDFALGVLTRTGFSFNIDDLGLPGRMEAVAQKLLKDELHGLKLLDRGVICPAERTNKYHDDCLAAQSCAEQAIGKHLFGGPPVESLLAAMSEARCGLTPRTLQPLCGLIGFTATPTPKYFLCFIASNFQSGLRMQDYFIRAGASRREAIRARSPQRALRTFHRQLMQLAQNVFVTRHDCRTRAGVAISRNLSVDDPIQDFARRVTGRVSLETVRDAAGAQPVISANELVTREIADRLAALGLPQLRVRHPLACEAETGVCRRCYGADPETGRLVAPATGVGIRAVLEIAGLLERLPTAPPTARGNRLPPPCSAVARSAGTVSLKHLKLMIAPTGERIAMSSGEPVELLNTEGTPIEQHAVPHGAEVLAAAGDRVPAGAVLARWNNNWQTIRARHSGKVEILSAASDRSWFLIQVLDAAGAAVDGCLAPEAAAIHVRNGDSVSFGTPLADVPCPERTPREPPTEDLHGIRQILAVRPVPNPAWLAPADGRVELHVDGRQPFCEIQIHPSGGAAPPHRQRLPLLLRQPIRVRTGDVVAAGDPLTVGDIDLRDQVRYVGQHAALEQLLDDLRRCVQRAKKSDRIDDRHWEQILVQLLRWVKVESPGDSGIEPGRILLRAKIQACNRNLRSLVKIRNARQLSPVVPPTPLTREAFEAVKSNWRSDDPKVKTLESEAAWPAGWSPVLLGWREAVEKSNSVLSGVEIAPSRKSLVRAALHGNLQELCGAIVPGISDRLLSDAAVPDHDESESD